MHSQNISWQWLVLIKIKLNPQIIQCNSQIEIQQPNIIMLGSCLSQKFTNHPINSLYTPTLSKQPPNPSGLKSSVRSKNEQFKLSMKVSCPQSHQPKRCLITFFCPMPSSSVESIFTCPKPLDAGWQLDDVAKRQRLWSGTWPRLLVDWNRKLVVTKRSNPYFCDKALLTNSYLSSGV
jgi:hypothetical protein